MPAILPSESVSTAFRPYQDAASIALRQGWKEGFKSQVVVQATGTGKTLVGAREAAWEISESNKVLWLAHREELLEQAQDKFETTACLRTALDKAKEIAGLDERCVVASVPTLCSDDRLRRYPSDHFGLIIIDECHHVMAASYRKILNHLTGARLIGLTATPDRGDKKEIGEVFQRVAFEYSLIDAVKDGYLARPVVRTIPLQIDMSKVESTGGDFNADQMEHALIPILPDIAREMWLAARDRKILVFMPTVDICIRMAGELQKVGFTADWIAGVSKDRKAKKEWFEAAGAGSVMVNPALWGEGVDIPSIDCVVNLCATRVRAKFCQIVGRATRLFPGKRNALVLDFLWHSSRHLLVKPAHLIAKTNDIAERATKKFDEGGVQDLIEGIIDAEHEHLRALAKRLKQHSKKKGGMVDPLDLGTLLDDLDTAEYEPMSEFDRMPKKIWQREKLEANGIDPNLVTCFGHAAHILEKIEERRRLGLASLKQVKLLKRYNIPDAAKLSFVECQGFIIGLAKRHWKPIKPETK